jgi:hypothetical protein
MTTLKQARERVNGDAANWPAYLMEFVDELRRTRDPRCIADPFEQTGDEKDALFASTAEALCDELGLDVPHWLSQIPACSEPYFVAGLENLKAISIVESPPRFRLRKVFVLGNFLRRV